MACGFEETLLLFDWDQANVGHIGRHGVSVEEVEHTLAHPTLDLGYQDWHGEERYAEVGATAMGRILVVVTSWRGDKIRVVTAFDASRSDAEEYVRFQVNL